MVLSLALSFIAIMLFAMYIEAERRTRKVDLRVVAAPPSPPKPITTMVRAELDDTPAYWDSRFHQLLESLDAPSVDGDEYDLYAFGGDLVRTYRERGYPDCPCPRCRRICNG